MKLSDLMDALSEYDASSDVLIAGKPSGYLNFKIEKHDDTSIEKGGLPIIALEATEEIGPIFVTVKE
jgi:hypothetical protein